MYDLLAFAVGTPSAGQYAPLLQTVRLQSTKLQIQFKCLKHSSCHDTTLRRTESHNMFISLYRCGWEHHHWNSGEKKQRAEAADQGGLPTGHWKGILNSTESSPEEHTRSHDLTLCIFPSQPLEAALKNALKGDLEEVVLALLKTPAQYDAQQLKLAMKVHTLL